MKRIGKRLVSGFTLIELLVVITIMSILTVITVSQFETARKKARDIQRKADLSSVSKALQMYYADYGVFPPASAANGGELVIGGGSGWGGEFVDASGYVYMKVLPRENRSDVAQYCYRISADSKKFALMAQLENRDDSECDKNGNGTVEASETRPCGGVNYCYYTVSPNTSLNVDGTFQ